MWGLQVDLHLQVPDADHKVGFVDWPVYDQDQSFKKWPIEKTFLMFLKSTVFFNIFNTFFFAGIGKEIDKLRKIEDMNVPEWKITDWRGITCEDVSKSYREVVIYNIFLFWH